MQFIDEPPIARAMAMLLTYSEEVSQQELRHALAYIDSLENNSQKDAILGILIPTIAQLSGQKAAMQRIGHLNISPKLNGLRSISSHIREHHISQRSVKEAISEIKYDIKQKIYTSDGAIKHYN